MKKFNEYIKENINDHTNGIVGEDGFITCENCGSGDFEEVYNLYITEFKLQNWSKVGEKKGETDHRDGTRCAGCHKWIDY